MPAVSTAHTRRASSVTWLVPLICGSAVMFDGYDLIVYASVFPQQVDASASR